MVSDYGSKMGTKPFEASLWHALRMPRCALWSRPPNEKEPSVRTRTDPCKPDQILAWPVEASVNASVHFDEIWTQVAPDQLAEVLGVSLHASLLQTFFATHKSCQTSVASNRFRSSPRQQIGIQLHAELVLEQC